MSLQGLAYNTMKGVYEKLPHLALATGGSALLSYATGRFVTRFSLGAPTDAAKFTAAAGLAFIGFKTLTGGFSLSEKSKLEGEGKPSLATYASRFILLSGLAYGVHALYNPEKTLIFFVKYSAVFIATFTAPELNI